MVRPVATVEPYHCYFVVSPSPDDAPSGIIISDETRLLPKEGYFHVKIGDGDSHESGRYKVHNPSFNLAHTPLCAKGLYRISDGDLVNPGTYLKKCILRPNAWQRTEWFRVYYKGNDDLRLLKSLLQEFSAFLENPNNDFGYLAAKTVCDLGGTRNEAALAATSTMSEMMGGHDDGGFRVDGFLDRFSHFANQ